MNVEDFPIINENFIYFDNGATTLKPKCVVDETVAYYTKYTANAHRGDYNNSLIVDKKYEATRVKVKDFIGASSEAEIIFTKGTTESLNMIVFGFMKYYLQKGDEVLLTKAEHASNILPWMELEKELGIVIKYMPLDEEFNLTIDSIKKSISKKTKVISIAHITNTVGDIRPVKEIGALCKEKGIIFVVDGAQSVPHVKIDVKDLNINFLVFSAHKMLGPTGVGILYGKLDLLEKLEPREFGGGMNVFFESSGDIKYKSLPLRLEAGTQNIAGVIGFGIAIDYLNEIGMENIEKHEQDLKKYLLSRLEEIPNLKIYNKTSKSGIVLFNLDSIFSQDTAIYLNHFNICVRAGNHCAKILKDEIGIANTCRISLYLYNTMAEIDKLIEVLKKSKNIFDVVI